MYGGVIDDFFDDGLAIERPTPVWMDKNSYIVAKEDAYGCKLTHNITHHDHIIVLDEVGGNTSQKGDGHIGGELMLYKQVRHHSAK